MDAQTVNVECEGGLALGAIVSITGAVIGTARLPNGKVTHLVQFERKGERFEDWFFADDVVDLGFDD